MDNFKTSPYHISYYGLRARFYYLLFILLLAFLFMCNIFQFIRVNGGNFVIYQQILRTDIFVLQYI